jgi:hypothetical protein
MRNLVIFITCAALAVILFLFVRGCKKAEPSISFEKSNRHVDSLLLVIKKNNEELIRIRKAEFEFIVKSREIKKEATKLPRIKDFKPVKVSKEKKQDPDSLREKYDSLYGVAEKKEVLLDSSLAVNDSLASKIEEAHKRQDQNDSLHNRVQDSLMRTNVELFKENEKLKRKGFWKGFKVGFVVGKIETYAEVAALKALEK